MDLKGYTILLQNLLNRAVDINIALGKAGDMEAIDATLEELKDLFRHQLQQFKGDK